mmetsp:Transcript_101545/g.302953  ORF Transcript_101545/g.302953 Transcript_101545/m.302953 type:complete len:225 (+) Transcript_101545:419-1093(+)
MALGVPKSGSTKRLKATHSPIRKLLMAILSTARSRPKTSKVGLQLMKPMPRPRWKEAICPTNRAPAFTSAVMHLLRLGGLTGPPSSTTHSSSSGCCSSSSSTTARSGEGGGAASSSGGTASSSSSTGSGRVGAARRGGAAAGAPSNIGNGRPLDLRTAAEPSTGSCQSSRSGESRSTRSVSSRLALSARTLFSSRTTSRSTQPPGLPTMTSRMCLSVFKLASLK